MIDWDSTKMLSDWASILATYGIYAVAIIFIILQRGASKDLKKHENTPQEEHYRRIHTAHVVGTIVYLTLSAGVWGYKTFIYHEQIVIRGAVSDLIQQKNEPKQTNALPEILDQVVPEGTYQNFYTITVPSDGDKNELSSLRGKCELRWAFFPDEDIKAMTFVFQHHYDVVLQQNRPGFLPLALPSDNVSHDTHLWNGKFRIDLAGAKYSASHPIHLIYVPDSRDPVKKHGHIYLEDVVNSKKIEIPWEDTSETIGSVIPEENTGIMKRIFEYVFVPNTAHAAMTETDSVFKSDGSYDLEVGKSIRQRLGGYDLKGQMDAKVALIRNGDRAFRFIMESLTERSDEKVDRSILVDNLTSVIKEIEKKGTPFPAKDHLILAKIQYLKSNFAYAAYHYDHAGDSPIHDTVSFFFRAFAYGQVGKDTLAIRDFKRYLSMTKSNYSKSITLTNLGRIYTKLQQFQEATQEYRLAIRLSPADPNAYNNLAYIYADRGDSLDYALSLVRIALNAQPTNPSYVDTKGWIYFKMNKYADALPLLARAAEADTLNEIRQKHVAIAKDSLRASRSTRPR